MSTGLQQARASRRLGPRAAFIPVALVASMMVGEVGFGVLNRIGIVGRIAGL